VGGHALRVLLTEEYAESNVRTLQDGFLYALLGARHGQVDRIALSDLPWAWRERVGLTMDLEEDTWYEFRWAAAPEAEPLAVLQALKAQIDRCPRAELTAAHVWELLERAGVRPVLEVLRSDRGVKQAVASIAPLARLCTKRNLMQSEERHKLLSRLRDHWNLSNAHIAFLFGVDLTTVGRWVKNS
jgi:hypothetical protein